MRKRIKSLCLLLGLLLLGAGCIPQGQAAATAASPAPTQTAVPTEALPSVSVDYISPEPTAEPTQGGSEGTEETPSGSDASPEPKETPEPSPEPSPLVSYAFTGGEDSFQELLALLAENPTLCRLDLRQSGLDIRAHAEELAALGLEELRFSSELCGVPVTEEEEVFAPLTLPAAEDLAVLRLMKGLRRMDLTGLELKAAQIAALGEAFPAVELLWKLDLCGVAVGPDTESLNFNDMPIDSLAPFYEVLPLLGKLTSLEMCGCGVGNKDMDALRAAFPLAGIVWSIQTPHWTVRTDVDHFATWRIARVDEQGKILEAYNISNTDEELSWLQYCHDLVALDVGHNKLTNCEFVRNMPKLQFLIVADNKITDLSPIGTLSELKYLEIFTNPITDLGPLSTLSNLLDLNLCGCYVSDLSPLYGLKKLERVWMTPFNLTDMHATAEAFRAELPNCQLQYIADQDFTGKGWRYHERYTELRLALGRAKP